MFFGEWMDKEGVIDVFKYTYTHSGILFSHKKNEILPLAATGMDLEGIMLSEISQIEKDKHCMIHLYVESKKENRIWKLLRECILHGDYFPRE